LAGLYRDIGLHVEGLDHAILRRGDSRGMEGHDFGGRQGGQADRDQQAGGEGWAVHRAARLCASGEALDEARCAA
jgi:hypothetical protein